MFDWENLVRKLSEQAYQKQKAEELITNEVSPLVEHIIKILKWEDSYNNPKHAIDIDQKWSDKIQDVLLKSKIHLKKNIIDRIIIDESIQNFDYYMNKLDKRYRSANLNHQRTNKEVKTDLLKVLNELSNRYYRFQTIKRDIEIIDILNDLGIVCYGVND